jgi:hypothetical protein
VGREGGGGVVGHARLCGTRAGGPDAGTGVGMYGVSEKNNSFLTETLPKL